MHPSRLWLRILAPAAALLLAACAKPIYKTGPHTTTATPTAVAAQPARYTGASVVWGGKIIRVRNFPDHSEVQILSCPLDRAQRPQCRKGVRGRFIASIPGYLEALNFPPNTPMTVAGTITHVRQGKVGEAPYMFPVVDVGHDYHRWTAEELRSPWSRIHIGLGLGGGSGGVGVGGGVGAGVGVGGR